MDTDDFVTEDRNLWIVLCAPQGNSNLRGVAVLLSADLHVTILNEDVVGIEGPVMIGVALMRREDQRALDVDERELVTLVDIKEQVLALGDLHSFSFLRWEIIAPSLRITPLAHVEDCLAHCGDITQSGDVDDKSGCVRLVGLV